MPKYLFRSGFGTLDPQVEGTKRWKLYASAVDHPRRGTYARTVGCWNMPVRQDWLNTLCVCVCVCVCVSVSVCVFLLTNILLNDRYGEAEPLRG